MTHPTAGQSRRRHRRSVRDRRGRGITTPLLPPTVPAYRSRSETFDHAVVEALAELGPQWHDDLALIEFAVDEVPMIPDGSAASAPNIVMDGGVPLSKFMTPGIDRRGRPTAARIVLYRRPLCLRVAPSDSLVDTVLRVITAQLIAVFGDDGRR